MSTFTVNATNAYARAANMIGAGSPAGAATPTAADAAAGGSDFSAMVRDAVNGAIDSGKEAEVKSAQNLAGKGELVDVVTALTAAETTLQTIVAVRDKVISAYQEISRMPI